MNENGNPQRPTLLVVDDTPDNIVILSSFLKNTYRIKVATNGLKALELAAADVPDLILLDIMMPEMDGYEVCQRLKEIESLKDIPVIFLSSLNEAMDKVKAFQAGGVDYVTKPFQAEEVRARVETHLKIRQLQIELIKQNEALQESYEKLQALSEQKDEFMRIASHDLKNPLTCILGFASLAEMVISKPEEIECLRDSLARIKDQSRIMEKIIGDFLDFHAMEDGQIKLAIEPVNLNELAQTVFENNSAYAASKEIDLQLNLDGALPEVDCDKSRINQVMENLLSNAIKFSPKGAWVRVITKSENGIATLEVVDSGPGLTEEDMGKLFKKYAKLSNKPTGGEKSSGLGLAIAKKVMELHCGKIGARNNADTGATFWFDLPVKF